MMYRKAVTSVYCLCRSRNLVLKRSGKLENILQKLMFMSHKRKEFVHHCDEREDGNEEVGRVDHRLKSQKSAEVTRQ